MPKFVFGSVLATLSFLAMMAMPAAAPAQVSVGGQGSWADDFDFGVGARVILGLPVPAFPLEAMGSFDWFFPDAEGLDYFEVNANVAYMIPVPAPTVAPYVGTGLNFARASFDGGSESEIGLNLLGGVKFPLANLTPYGEIRFEVSGGEQFVVTGGVALQVGPGL